MKNQKGLQISISFLAFLFYFSFQLNAQQIGRGGAEGITTNENKKKEALLIPFNDVCIMGSGKLENGSGEIIFDKVFDKIIPSKNGQVIITPVGSWSGIYITEVSENGFKVKSESGDINANFNWVLLGEKKER
jgi:hypothetical protein